MKTSAPRALALILLLGAVAPAQTRPRRVEPPDAVAQNSDAPVALEGSLIEVPVVVSDRSGRYVPSLGQHDFELTEDGRPQTISFFRSERLPIHVALLLDTSLSTRFALDDIHEAAIDFVNELLPGDEIMVVSFAAQVVVEQEFTSDRRLLAEAIRRAQPTRGTRLYEAVYRTAAERLRGVDGRKAIVILSDGQDVGSAIDPGRAVGVCSESDVTVYGVRYPRAADVLRDRRDDVFGGTPFPRPRRESPRASGGRPLDPFMDTVTANSGGALFMAATIGDVGALFRKIADDLRHVYVLGYEPSNPVSNGGYRTIHVGVPSRPELAVRHRLGYQAGAP